jgi:hypothetical protein
LKFKVFIILFIFLDVFSAWGVGMKAKNGWLPFSTGLSHEPFMVQTGANGHHPLGPVRGSNRCKRGGPLAPV